MKELQGLLRIFTLSSLSHSKASGKEIALRVFDASGQRWKPSFGSIYPLLAKMEKEKLIKSSSIHEKGEIFYEITKKGTLVLNSERKDLSERMDEHLRACMPLIMQILHGWSNEEVKEFHKEHEEFLLLRDKLLKLPQKKRKAVVRKLFDEMRRSV